jgi:hypothetical protein
MKSFLIILANEATDEGLDQVLVNEISAGDDGWALLLPYGSHPNTRFILQNGREIQQDFLQIVDEAAVDEIIANEQSLFSRMKRFFMKRPVYRGHPDFKKFVPDVIANQAPMTPLGTVDEYRKSERGLEVRLGLVESGAQAVSEDGCKYTSALVSVRRAGDPVNGVQPVRVCKILSVGLTPRPNISGVDSLANARANTPAANNPQQKDEEMKALLIGWLAAQGITLANDAAEQTVFDAVTKAWVNRGTELTTLGNEKSTLNGEVTTLKNEKTTLTTERDRLKTDLGTAQTALANERKARAEALVDLAIAQGKVAPADRDARITKLTGAGDKFTDEATALANEAVKYKTTTSEKGERKNEAGTERTPSEQVLYLANSDARYKDKSWDEAYKAILSDHPALAEQLKQQPETKK